MGTGASSTIRPDYGLPPLDPSVETVVPKWKKRQKSPVRKVLRLVLKLAVIAALGVGGYFVYQKVAASSDADATSTDAVADPPAAGGAVPGVIDQAQTVVDDVNADAGETEALGDLGLAADGNPDAAASDAIERYEFVWSNPLFTNLIVNVDIATKNYSVTDGAFTVRRVDGKLFSQPSRDSEWAASDVSIVPEVLLAGPLDASTMFTSDVAPWASGPSERAGGAQVYVIDETSMFIEEPTIWAAYMTRWGSSGEQLVSPPDQDMVVIMQFGADDVVVSVTIESVTLGGSSTYLLSAMSPGALAIAVPAIGP